MVLTDPDEPYCVICGHRTAWSERPSSIGTSLLGAGSRGGPIPTVSQQRAKRRVVVAVQPVRESGHRLRDDGMVKQWFEMWLPPAFKWTPRSSKRPRRRVCVRPRRRVRVAYYDVGKKNLYLEDFEYEYLPTREDVAFIRASFSRAMGGRQLIGLPTHVQDLRERGASKFGTLERGKEVA